MALATSRYRLLAAVSAASLAMLLAAPAAAQDQQSPQAPAPATAPRTGEPDPQATAQSTPDDTGTTSEVVVTGFRESLASAINAKRNDNGVIDVIKAEDIAAFPDLNLAESLQRIPGVAISREGGEGRQISVRGLGPDYTRVRLNGIEALATSGSSDSGGASGTNRGRGFDFNIFASELFNSLTVRKSASADVEEGSLGATVDLQTGRPFDFKKPTFVLSAQAGYNDAAQKLDPRLAAIATTTLADGTFGVLVSAAYGKRHVLEEGFGTTRWDTGASQGGFCSPAGYDVNPTTAGVQTNPTTGGAACGTGGPARLANTADNIAAYNLASAATTFLPRIPSYNQFNLSEDRLGLTGSVQWQPTKRTLVTLDLLYAKLSQYRDERALQALGLSRSGTGKPQTTVAAFSVDSNSNLVAATLNNVDLRTQTRIVDEGTKFRQATLSGTQELSDTVRVSALAGRARSRFDTFNDTTVTFDRNDVQNYKIDLSQNNRTPLITYDLDPTLPASWTAVNGTSEVRLRPGYVTTRIDTVKGDAEWDVTPDIQFKAGGDYRASDFNTIEFRRASETVINTLTADQIAQYSQQTTDFGQGLNLPSGVATQWLSPDVDKYAAGQNIYSNSGIFAISSSLNSSARGNTSFVHEADTSGFAMTNVKGDLFGIHARGDIGVRYTHTNQRSTGYAAVGNSINLVTVERGYNNFLPSLNLAFDVADDVVVRIADAITIARPSLSALTPGGDVSVQGANRTFTTGNPFINPTKSKNLDLSFEWYPQRGALYGLGLFYKNISTFAQTLRTSAIFNTLGLPDSLLTGTGAVTTDEFAVTRPVNSPGGTLKGFELNVQQPLTFLPGFLSGFGVIANYTYVDSTINYLTSAVPGAPTVAATLVGLSKNTANGTLYYEKGKLSVRGSVSYRSGYLTQVPGRNNNFVEGTNATTNIDARIAYKLTDRIEVSAEGINLTNQANDQYVDFTNRVNAYRVDGRQFFLGVRASF